MRRILTIKQAAQLIEGLTEYRVRQMCKTGQLRSFKAGNKYLIAEEDLYENSQGGTEMTERETYTSAEIALLPRKDGGANPPPANSAPIQLPAVSMNDI